METRGRAQRTSSPSRLEPEKDLVQLYTGTTKQSRSLGDADLRSHSSSPSLNSLPMHRPDAHASQPSKGSLGVFVAFVVTIIAVAVGVASFRVSTTSLQSQQLSSTKALSDKISELEMKLKNLEISGRENKNHATILQLDNEKLKENLNSLEAKISSTQKSGVSVGGGLTPTIPAADISALEKKMKTSLDASLDQVVSKHLSEVIPSAIEDAFKKDMPEHYVKTVNSMISKQVDEVVAGGVARVDFALADTGGSVLLHSESFVQPSFHDRVLAFIPRLRKEVPPSSNPLTSIQATTGLGHCWAMKGSEGFLTVMLSHKIRVEAITVEHVPSSIAINFSSAPKGFRAMALASTEDTSGPVLVEGVYQSSARHVQTFEVPPARQTATQYVRFEVLSNHGNNGYTCLYRVRVHGKMVQSQS